MKVGVIGAGGYAGGELLRLLDGHPEVGEIVAGSESLAGKPVTVAHPNLRKRTSLEFVPYEGVTGCDVVFLSLPNGAHRLTEFRSRGTLVIDLSSDHRLNDLSRYREWYESDHPHPELLRSAVYGIPELHRDEIKTAKLVTGAGCNATATILALLPLVRAGLVDSSRPVVVECKVGSSEGGREPGEDSHHPERAGVVRSFKPVGHR
ncbi:MAG TPA: N-acetyl-gamma-glutamyl-phosphate reductase, partial [Candidatus Limnocylindria bacterium]